MNADILIHQQPADVPSGHLCGFAEACRRIGLPPVSVSPLFAEKLLPLCLAEDDAHAQTLNDLIWSIRGSILGLIPCTRTSIRESVTYQIRFWSRTAGSKPVAHNIAAELNHTPEGGQRLRLILPEEMPPYPEFNNTILLVEDDPEVAPVEQLLLEEVGFTVQLVGDGLEALHRAQTEFPAAIVLDADLPGLDGFEVCRRLKANPATRHLPILFCSGNPNALHLALASGADKVLCKPEGICQLAANVYQLLKR